MALQPAAGARDLHPREVDRNRQLADQLAAVYRLWGYQEVSPPSIERLDTLEAGGGIAEQELVRLVSDEPLGLRPEMTASIARVACTRLALRPRPLRLWACGPVFLSSVSDSGGQRIGEQLQSGVELLGVAGRSADAELLRLLLAALGALPLQADQQAQLLIGHHGILTALLAQVPEPQRQAARRALTGFDPLALSQLQLPAVLAASLQRLLRLRGEPTTVLYQLEQVLGPLPLLEELALTLEAIAAPARQRGVAIQLDPTFQPHFNLYDGLVFKVVCQGQHAPVEIASGGRYDALVGRFATPGDGVAAGVGFGFQVEAIRELLTAPAQQWAAIPTWLVAYSQASLLPAALDRIESLHSQAEAAELLSEPCASQGEAERLAAERGCSGVIWLAS
ncbi:MAG: ATP phosphoribosyltransferase regulatory subunit [Prochlorococcaceae cyanobacterium]